MRIEKRLQTPAWLSVAVPVGSILVAFIAASILIAASGNDPWYTYTRLFERAFTANGAFTNTIVTATPLLLTGLGTAAAFRMGLWNIGAEGQLYMGAAAAAGTGVALAGLPGPMIVVAMVGAGLLAGLLWAFVPAILRAYLNTNEIITTLMLNYIGGLLLNYLIFDTHSYWRDDSTVTAKVFPQGKHIPVKAQWPGWLTAFDPAVDVLVIGVIALGVWAWQQKRAGRPMRPSTPASIALGAGLVLTVAWMFEKPNLVARLPFGFILGLVGAVGLWFAYRSTRFGYEARVVGDSPPAARYAGMRTRRKILSVMAVSGALAGLAGASQVGDFQYTLDPKGIQAAHYGYTGIVVAALGRYNPYAVALVAVLLGGLQNAGYSLQGPDFPAGLVGTLQGLILFFALGGELLLAYRIRFHHRSAADGPLAPPSRTGDRETRPPLAAAAGEVVA